MYIYVGNAFGPGCHLRDTARVQDGVPPVIWMLLLYFCLMKDQRSGQVVYFVLPR